MLLFKISRLMSFISFLCISLSFYLLFFQKQSYTLEELLLTILLTIICIFPLLIFNWLCFQKLTLWIQKNSEND